MIGDKAGTPTRLAGVPADLAAITYLEKIDKEIGEITSIADVLMGRLSYSGTPNSLAQTLLEQAVGRFGPVQKSLGMLWENWAKQQLSLFKTHGDGTRISRTMNEFGDLAIQSFSNADFSSGVELRLENSSTMPKSDIISSVQLQTAIQNGLIDIADPKVRYQALKKLNLTDMVSETDAQYQSAAAENRLLAQGIMVPASALLDDVTIHVASHVKAANSPSLSPQLKVVFEQHILDHQVKMMSLMQATAPPPEEGGVGGKSPAKSIAVCNLKAPLP
jgi:hypothetical protein